VVFATAFDSFAVDAFNVHALDYLLKPIDPRRLEQSLERVRKYRTRTREDEPALGEKGRLMTALSELPSAPRQIISRGPEFVEKKLAIRDGQQTLLIPYDDIDWIDAAGDYMCIHAQGATHIMRCTMKQLEAKLQDPRFARIHRSTLVNLTRILSVVSLGKGESLLHLPNDVTLKVSRNFREALVDYLD
jgi:two-component system LytT family response regulator